MLVKTKAPLIAGKIGCPPGPLRKAGRGSELDLYLNTGMKGIPLLPTMQILRPTAFWRRALHW